MGKLGVVVGSPNVKKFHFGTKADSDIKRGQLVESYTNNKNKIISQVIEINVINEYFGESSIQQQLHRTDISSFLDKTVLLATAIPLAMLNQDKKGEIEPPDVPVAIGSDVFPVSDNQIATRVFGFQDNGINLGTMMYNENIQVNLNPNKLIPTHIALFAQTGGGKTHTVMIMLEEFSKKPLYLWDEVIEKESITHFLVVDTHGEYAKKINRTDEMFVFEGPYTIPLNELPNGPYFIKDILPELTEPQFRLLEEAWSRIDSQNLSLLNIRANIKLNSSAKQKQTENILLSLLARLERHKIIGDTGSINILELILKYKFLILDFGKISSFIQQIYLRYALSVLFNNRTEGKIPPLCVVIEEIHNFAPSTESSLPRNIIRNIAREGRKFCLGLCITSQRPSMIDTTLLSQCSTIIALRTTNETDLRSISAIAEGMDVDMLQKIPPGIALIAGRAVNYPIYVRIKSRTDSNFKRKKILEIDKSGQGHYLETN